RALNRGKKPAGLGRGVMPLPAAGVCRTFCLRHAPAEAHFRERRVQEVSNLFSLKRLSSFVALAVLAVPSLSFAIEPAESPDASPLFARAFRSTELDVQPSAEIYKVGAQTPAARALESFFAHHSQDWEVRWDRRSDRANLIQGVGVP